MIKPLTPSGPKNAQQLDVELEVPSPLDRRLSGFGVDLEGSVALGALIELGGFEQLKQGTCTWLIF